MWQMGDGYGVASKAAWPAIDRRDGLLEIEMLVADLSSRFINRPSHEVDSEIEDGLCRICRLIGIDLAVLWQWSGTAGTVIVPTHIYSSQEGYHSHAPLCQELFPWVRQQMLAGQVVAFSSLEEMPLEAAVDRKNGELIGIKSTLSLPLSVGGEPPIGALAFNTLLVKHAWTSTLVTRLQLVAQVFTNALVRRRHERRLQESEARLQAGAELAGLAFYEVDLGQRETFIDDRFRQLCGIPMEQEGKLKAVKFWRAHLQPEDRQRVLDLHDRLRDGDQDRLSMEYCYQHPVDGAKWIRHLAGATRRDASGRALCIYGVLRDVTEQKRAESEMRNLSRSLIRAQEDERALLARELHDDVTQRLAVLAIEAGRAELAAPDKVQGEVMQSIRQGLMRLSEDVHSLAYQLHPSVLQELGLIEALRAECERRVRQGRLDLSVKLDPLPAVGEDVALCLFRVVQEALNNVLRHAASRVGSVTLRAMDDGLLLAVRDEGVGFDPDHPRERMHLGLASMRERVRLVNGTLDIESAPGHGTTIVVWVPVASEAR